MENKLCPICLNTKTKTILKTGPFSIEVCSNCGLTYLFPKPSASEIKKIYENNYFVKGEVTSGYIDYVSLENDLVKEAKRRLEVINHYVTQGKILDVGCGAGYFINVAQKSGFKVFGCDISPEAKVLAKKIFNIDISVGPFEEKKVPNGPFDIITCWDTFEHFNDLNKTVKAFSENHKNGGYLFLTTPNVESLDARILGKFWYGFRKIPEHLYFFSPKTIKNILQKGGYEVVSIKQWGFQRNLGYSVSQIGRYNKFLSKIFKKIIYGLKLDNLSFYFPFIDMLVVARKIPLESSNSIISKEL